MSLRKTLFITFSVFTVAFVALLGVLTSPELKAACLSSAATAGQSARASQYNNLREDFYTGKFFDSACAGSNYLQVLHNGTDGVIQTNTGKIRISPPSGSTIDLEVNGTDVLVIGGAGITASQYIAGAGNLGISGSAEVDGRTQLDGAVAVAGVMTLSGALNSSSDITTTGKMAIGSSTVDQYLYVKRAASGRAWSTNAVDIANFENNTHAAIDIITPDASVGYLMFSDVSTRNMGHLAYDHNADTFTIWGNGATQATLSGTSLNLQDNAITTSGNITTTGTGTITSAGLLSANLGVQLSSSANHNSTLDSYFQGSWTPSYSGTTSAGAGTYSTQVGTYTRIGNVVHLTYNITTTAHTGTGNMALNIPVTANTTTGVQQVCPPPEFQNVTLPAGQVMGSMLIDPSFNNVAQIRSCPNASGGSCAAVAIDTAMTIKGSCTIITNDL